MPCDMYKGVTSGDFAMSDAHEALKRIAALEQALCGLCQQIIAADPTHTTGLHPQLQAWFDAHRRVPGCQAQ